jgi:DNA-directed RNA polymerase sigma subunit (sigma70/sigma32)
MDTMPRRTPQAITPETTHDEVAAMLGVSRQRAQQIEQTALAKARAVLERRGLTAADLFDLIQRGHHGGGPVRE